MGWENVMNREMIAKRAVLELNEGEIINLGIGIPTLIANYLDESKFYVHTENGMLGVIAHSDTLDPNIVNAGKLVVGESKAASYFSSADSFAMIRGGHVSTAILGALQVDESGKIANWAVPGMDILGVGGAMDLLEGAGRIIVTTSHTTNDGKAKFVKECTYPITSKRVIDVLITDKAVFKWMDNQFELVELMGDTTLEEVMQHTEAKFKVNTKLHEGKEV